MIHVDCGACGAGFRVKETHAGRRARCTKCGEVLVIPTPEDELEVQALETIEDREELAVHHLEPLEDGGDEYDEEDEEDEESRHARHILEERRRKHELELAAKEATARVMLYSFVAALLGVVLWVAVAVAAGQEYAFLAVVIGAGVGAASMMAGGRGPAHATHAAVFAVLAMLGGRVLAVSLLEMKPLAEARVEATTEYEHWLAEGNDWALLPFEPTRMDIAAFVAAHGHAASEDPASVTDEEINSFWEDVMPVLEKFEVRPPPKRETWVKKRTSELSGWSQHSVLGIAYQSTGWTFLLFAVLGIAAAYAVVLNPFRGTSDD